MTLWPCLGAGTTWHHPHSFAPMADSPACTTASLVARLMVTAKRTVKEAPCGGHATSGMVLAL
eukprot:4579260-Amphidinium_carterae.1